MTVRRFAGNSSPGSPPSGSRATHPPSRRPSPSSRSSRPTINLSTARDRQLVVVQATYADGITRDVTAEAAMTPGQPRPRPPRGRTRSGPPPTARRPLAVAFGGQAVDGARQGRAGRRPRRRISFRLDVMPVFMRAGCNTGSCHGAARGKDGFRLSLFGFDPEGDYHRLTREMVGRRINLAVPADSTLLEKATGAVPHTGGKRFEPASELYRTLHAGSTPAPPTTTSPSSPTSSASSCTRSRPCSTAKGSHPADDRPRQVLRRHRPRRHRPGRLPDQQRDLGRRSTPTAWSPPASAARRSSWPASRPSPSARRCSSCPRGSQFALPRRARGQLHRHAGRRQAEEAAHRPLGPLHRRGVPPPRRTSTSSACCRRVEEYRPVHGSTRPRQAGQADRRAARAARSSPRSGSTSGPSCSRCAQSPTRSATRGCSSTTTGWSSSCPEEHADGPDGAGAPRRPAAAPSPTRRPTSTRRPTTSCCWPRTSPRSSWACASSAPSATTTRSTAGRRTTTTASPPSSPRSAASRARTTARRSSSTPAAARSTTPSAAA